MTCVLHTARISNVEFIKFVVNNKDGYQPSKNGPAHNESLVAQLVRAPDRYLGGHGFDSRRGLRIFSLSLACVMLNTSSSLTPRCNKIPVRSPGLIQLCRGFWVGLPYLFD